MHQSKRENTELSQKKMEKREDICSCKQHEDLAWLSYS